MIVNTTHPVKVIVLVALTWLTLAMSGCGPAQTANETTETTTDVQQASLANEAAANNEVTGATPIPTVVADAATILARKEVPVLCYHQVREWKPGDSQSAKDYIISAPPASLRRRCKCWLIAATTASRPISYMLIWPPEQTCPTNPY